MAEQVYHSLAYFGVSMIDMNIPEVAVMVNLYRDSKRLSGLCVMVYRVY